MPWKSRQQEKWGNSPAGHKALGAKGVEEWNEATKGKKLPKTAKHSIREKHDMADHISRVTRK